MIGFCSTRLQLLYPSRSNAPHFTRLYSSKSLLGNTQDEKALTFTVSYFINSIGSSPEQALSASMKMRQYFDTPKTPDSVIKLLKHHGLSDTHIFDTVMKFPALLVCNAEKTLCPKLQFLSSIGLSGTDLARIFHTNASIMTMSLERSIRPCYDLMKRLEIPVDKFPCFISNYHMFKLNVLSNVVHNTSILRAHGVPEAAFPLWVPTYFHALSFDSEKVKCNVNKVMSMGFQPEDATFMRALYVISVTNASKWKEKMECYRKWGLTEDDVLSAFRKNPLFMVCSDKIISTKMDFYVNTMGCKPSDVAGCPDLLNYSLEKRIIPRYSVIRRLQVEGLIAEEDVSIHTILKRSDKFFLERFVIKYQEQIPELPNISQEKKKSCECVIRIRRRRWSETVVGESVLSCIVFDDSVDG